MAPPDILDISPSVLYFGTPVVLVGTADRASKANITPISSAWALGQNIVMGLGTTGQALRNIRETGECTVNLPSADLWARVEAIARTTGRSPVPPDKARMGYVHCDDKFTLGNFTALPSEYVRAPRIADCPLQMECRIAHIHGEEAKGHVIVDAEVARVHAHRDIVVEATHHIDTARWNPLFFVFRQYFGNAARLGQNFRAES